jgi:hypothetical protein
MVRYADELIEKYRHFQFFQKIAYEHPNLDVEQLEAYVHKHLRAEYKRAMLSDAPILKPPTRPRTTPTVRPPLKPTIKPPPTMPPLRPGGAALSPLAEMDAKARGLARKKGIAFHAAYAEVIASPEGQRLYDSYLATKRRRK